MRYLLFFIFVLVSCANKPKSVYICGDHVCVNKEEAKQYFEKNLTLEVKILDNKKKLKETSLIELNLRKEDNRRKVSLAKKEKTQENLKKLSPSEIKIIKSNLKKKKFEDEILESTASSKKEEMNYSNNKTNRLVEDVCILIEECSIDEISKFLINEGKNKKFPDITSRQ